MNIIETFEQNKTNYKIRCGGRVASTDSPYISVIIPVHGRTEFTKVVSHFLLNAINNSSWKISVTFVEHDEEQQHEKLVPDWANYIFIPKNGQRFNKCLCHNIGVLEMPKAEWYNFHDIDTIMSKDYFTNIMRNMLGKNALQTFTKRRLLLAGENFTKNVLANYESMKDLPQWSTDVRAAQAGAKGGSMFVSRDLFFDVGGFDPQFSEYSIEDASFYEQLEMVGKLGHCDSPPNELIHLSHPPSFWKRTKQEDFDYYESFKNASEEIKKEFISLRSKHLRSFI